MECDYCKSELVRVGDECICENTKCRVGRINLGHISESPKMNPKQKVKEMVEGLIDSIYSNAYRLDDFDLDVAKREATNSELAKMVLAGVWIEKYSKYWDLVVLYREIRPLWIKNIEKWGVPPMENTNRISFLNDVFLELEYEHTGAAKFCLQKAIEAVRGSTTGGKQEGK